MLRGALAGQRSRDIFKLLTKPPEMPKFTFRERRAVGDRFVQFLKDMGQEHESSREVLRGIYSWKFKNR